MKASQKDLFATVPTSKYMPFYRQGTTDLKKVANFFEFSNNDVAKIANVSENSVRYSGARVPQLLKTKLEEIANTCEIVASNFNGDTDKTTLWFKMENPMLGNLTPRDMIRFGRYKKLKSFIFDAMEGNLP